MGHEMTPMGVVFSAHIPIAHFLRTLCQQLHLVIWRGRKRRVWGVLTFRYTAPARAGNGGRGHGCCPVPIRPTQWLTRPNGAVLSPPAGRRSSLCQQHRDPGIEWTCISSLCPSASRPSKVGPGCRPELQPAYSRTRCLPLPCRMAAPPLIYLP